MHLYVLGGLRLKNQGPGESKRPFSKSLLHPEFLLWEPHPFDSFAVLRFSLNENENLNMENV